MARRFSSLTLLAVLLAVSSVSASDPAATGLRELRPEERITADELRKKQLAGEAMLIYDARTREVYEESHLSGALLPLGDAYYRELELYRRRIIPSRPDSTSALEENMSAMDRKTPIVTYCNTDCKASTVLLLELKKLGFTDVRAMEEGIQAWEKKGYPIALSVPRLSQRASE